MNVLSKNLHSSLSKIAIVAMFILFSTSMFSQQKESKIVVEIEKSTQLSGVEKAIALDSEVDFVGWFMGSKQLRVSNDDSEMSSSTKKKIILRGVAPNKVLYRVFMKKVMSLDSAIA